MRYNQTIAEIINSILQWMDPKGIEPFMNIGAQSSTMILLTYLILLKGPTAIPSSKILHNSLDLGTH